MIQNQPKWNQVHGIKLELLICWILQFLKNPWRSAVQLVNQTFDKKNKLANPFFLLCFSRMHFTKSKIKSNFILESTTWQEENKIAILHFFVVTQNFEPFKNHTRSSSILIFIYSSCKQYLWYGPCVCVGLYGKHLNLCRWYSSHLGKGSQVS